MEFSENFALNLTNNKVKLQQKKYLDNLCLKKSRVLIHERIFCEKVKRD